jgi:hypothetical protein
LRSVFDNGDFWGRQILDQGEFWEYKSASSSVFHTHRDQVQLCLMDWLDDDFDLQNTELLSLNMILCHDWRREYPITINLNTDIAWDSLSISGRDLVLDHWDRSITSDREFVYVAYHYQRKNRYWKCSINSVE